MAASEMRTELAKKIKFVCIIRTTLSELNYRKVRYAHLDASDIGVFS